MSFHDPAKPRQSAELQLLPQLSFQQGTIEFRCAGPWGAMQVFERRYGPEVRQIRRWMHYHDQCQTFVGPAYLYAPLKRMLWKIPGFIDKAAGYGKLSLVWAHSFQPRTHQLQALSAWIKVQSRGCCILPTGSGKTLLGCMAMQRMQRSTLVVVPTINLMQQWQEVIASNFHVSVGLWGGGDRQLSAITVITYDSARSVLKQNGDRFGLIIFDECHHLAAQLFRQIGEFSLAPYRLGLTATFERGDGEHVHIERLVGPRVYEAAIHEMHGGVLSSYDVITWEVELAPSDREVFQQQRQIYVDYLKNTGMSLADPGSWRQFVLRASASLPGRRALQAYRIQKKIATNSQMKIRELWKILHHHVQEKILIFTHDNDLAYRIGMTYILPVITHHTSLHERRQLLQDFRHGHMTVLVTSRVLNEGVDVPDASVGVVVSGSGSVREHVQRLGRILRHRPHKRAKLYELISQGTPEASTHRRRRQHDAYQRPDQVYRVRR